MDFSLMFWGCAEHSDAPHYYENLLKIVRYADAHGFTAICLPERHFNVWGGMHPNPSVLASAIAAVTSNLRLRAASVVLPLHDPLRVVEEWCIVDNLSKGRVELAFAAGWKDDDFVLAPGRFATRKEYTWSSIELIEKLWRGEKLNLPNGAGQLVSVATYPRPVQQQVPIWVTSAGGIRTSSRAGQQGYNLLTHILGQDHKSLANKVQQFNAYRARENIATPAKVSLMLHTFIGPSISYVADKVRPAMTRFLLQSAELLLPQTDYHDWATVDEDTKAELADLAFERYFDISLFGSPSSCVEKVARCEEIGVTEVCCLIDFGMPIQDTLDSLVGLKRLKLLCDGA